MRFRKEELTLNTLISTLKVILFFDDLKLLYAKKLDSKLAVRMFCLTVYRFLAENFC